MGVSRFEQIEKLTNLNHGAIEELFAPEFKRVLNNLADNNCELLLMWVFPVIVIAVTSPEAFVTLAENAGIYAADVPDVPPVDATATSKALVVTPETADNT